MLRALIISNIFILFFSCGFEKHFSMAPEKVLVANRIKARANESDAGYRDSFTKPLIFHKLHDSTGRVEYICKSPGYIGSGHLQINYVPNETEIKVSSIAELQDYNRWNFENINELRNKEYFGYNKEHLKTLYFDSEYQLIDKSLENDDLFLFYLLTQGIYVELKGVDNCYSGLNTFWVFEFD